MNIRFLDAAIWLAHYRNFRLTAEHLHISQAAISSRIAVLEEEFGQRLFERGPRDVTLTPAGERFLEGARDVVACYGRLQDTMRVDTTLQGHIRIGVASSMAHFLLPPITRTLRQEYPGVSFDIVTDDSGSRFPDLLMQNRIDICLTVAPGSPLPDTCVVPLCTLAMKWVASPSLVPRSQDYYTPADLARFPIITYPEGTVNGQRVREYLADAKGGPSSLITSSSLATSISMVSSGIGIAVIPEIVIQRELHEATLHKLNVHVPYPPTAYAALYTSQGNFKAAVKLSELAVQAARTLCGSHDPALSWLPDGN